MSRADGFAVMDVSTDICNDPKFRRLHRQNPEYVAVAFMAYTATLGESWKAGRRVAVVDAWPALTPFSEAVVAAMVASGLLDRRGMIPAKPWEGWYRPAQERREQSRERWRRANAKRHDDSASTNDVTAELPRGTRDVPRPPSVPPVRPSEPSVPSAPTEGIQGVEPSVEDAPRPRLVNPARTA